jgi:hypothetical protein
LAGVRRCLGRKYDSNREYKEVQTESTPGKRKSRETQTGNILVNRRLGEV